jgi:hypothetical protein
MATPAADGFGGCRRGGAPARRGACQIARGGSLVVPRQVDQTSRGGPVRKYTNNFWMIAGEPAGTRTQDHLIKSQVLYQLSYGLAAADVEACAGPVNSKPSGTPVMFNALALSGPLARQPAGGEAPPRRSTGYAGEAHRACRRAFRSSRLPDFAP